MIVRAEDFLNKNVFLLLAEEAQAKGMISPGYLGWDERYTVADISTLEIRVTPVAATYEPPDPNKEED
jgi:hypothetical protein